MDMQNQKEKLKAVIGKWHLADSLKRQCWKPATVAVHWPHSNNSDSDMQLSLYDWHCVLKALNISEKCKPSPLVQLLCPSSANGFNDISFVRLTNKGKDLRQECLLVF